MTLAYLLAALDPPGNDPQAADRLRHRSIPRKSATPSGPTDTELVVRISTSDEAAFATLFDRYFHPLTIVAHAIVRSRDAAEDVVQAVLLRVWRRREALVVQGSVAQYLRSAVYNEAKNFLTHDARIRNRGTRAVAFNAISCAAGTPSPDASVAEQELATIVSNAINALPARAGDIFRLWLYSDLSYAEIAETLGISVKGVEQGRARALAILRKTLLPLLRDEDRPLG
jgi:RNA polymerase sigma-70 factor (ECF subfamily)